MVSFLHTFRSLFRTFFLEKDYYFHPGVTLAVHEAIGMQTDAEHIGAEPRPSDDHVTEEQARNSAVDERDDEGDGRKPISGPDGAELNAPLDTTSPVAWVAYANADLHATIEPVFQEVLKAHFLL
mgnify:CR=1 FL=1